MTRTGRPGWAVTARNVPVLPGLLLAAALATAGCSLVEDAAQNQVDNATERAGEAVQGEVEQQAQSALDDALAQADNTCSQLLAATEAERTSVLGGVLQAFWLAELSTEQAPQDVVASWTAAVVTSCEASGEAQVADVARQTYDGGGYGPPQG